MPASISVARRCRTGDGILLEGRTLYVLQNGDAPGVLNQIAVIRLSRDLTSGRIVATRTSELFETATTLAKRGNLFVAVNAQFGASADRPRSRRSCSCGSADPRLHSRSLGPIPDRTGSDGEFADPGQQDVDGRDG